MLPVFNHGCRDYNVGKIFAKCKGFVDYVKKSLRKLKLELPKVQSFIVTLVQWPVHVYCVLEVMCGVCLVGWFVVSVCDLLVRTQMLLPTLLLSLFSHPPSQALTDPRILDYWKEYQPYQRTLFAFHQVRPLELSVTSCGCL